MTTCSTSSNSARWAWTSSSPPTTAQPANRDRFWALLKDEGVVAYICGHTHNYPVAAQEGGEGEVLPCGGESVSGTVVAVDEETRVVTVDTGDGLCTVMLDGEYDHPIVALLGSYFGDVSAESLTTALEATQGCAVYDPDSDAWTWADCDVEDAVAVTVVAENENGTFTFSATVEGEEVTGEVIVGDTEATEHLGEALQALAVDWELDGDGAVVQIGDEIAPYHKDGLGFGVLVKLYAMSSMLEEMCADADEPCGATVEELVEAFQSGVGMGELFEEYGKPSVLGVGHVKDKSNGPPAHAGPKLKNDGDDVGDEGGGPPDHAGPPAHAGPKPKKNK